MDRGPDVSAGSDWLNRNEKLAACSAWRIQWRARSCCRRPKDCPSARWSPDRVCRSFREIAYIRVAGFSMPRLGGRSHCAPQWRLPSVWLDDACVQLAHALSRTVCCGGACALLLITVGGYHIHSSSQKRFLPTIPPISRCGGTGAGHSEPAGSQARIDARVLNGLPSHAAEIREQATQLGIRNSQRCRKILYTFAAGKVLR